MDQPKQIRTTARHQTLQQSESSYKLSTGQIIAGKFKLIDKVGQGSFGMIYKTENTETGEVFATKFEKKDENTQGISLLVREIKVLIEIQGIVGFPQITFYGRDEHYNYFMQTYLGYNLEQLLKRCVKFSMQSVLRIAIQVLERLKQFHGKNLIHRDLKPDNMVIGYDDPELIYLIDFGLSKYFKDSRGNHITQCEKKGIVGTARYASITAHLSKEQSRRDDIESLGYVLVYMAKSKLPWMNIQTQSKTEKYQKILECKQNITLEKLCEGLPKCFIKLFIYSRGLEFMQEPDYNFLKQLFVSELDNIPDFEFEWERISEIKKRKIRFQNSKLKKQEDTTLQIRRSVDENVFQDSKKQPSFLNVPTQDQEQNSQEQKNKKSRNLSNNISSFGTSQVNQYQTSNVNQRDQFKRHPTDLQRKESKSKTYAAMGTQPPKVFIKEATVKTMDRKMAFFEIDEDYKDFDDIDQIADDETHINFQNIVPHSLRGKISRQSFD